MTNTKDVIIKLKEVQKEKNLSLDKIGELIDQNGEYVSKTTLSRVFRKGSEEHPDKFRYEATLRPIANALLDIENFEPDDDVDTLAYKSILKLKKNLLDDLEKQNSDLKEEIRKSKLKYHEKLTAETDKFQKSLDFAMHQIELKDKRIDQLLESNMQLLNQLLTCPCRNGGGK
jgi:transcriptional regulator with XRE-family HTH domain